MSDRASLLGKGAHVLRHLHALAFGDPKPRISDEQKAAMHIYDSQARRVRAVPTRRPVNRKGDAA